MARPLEQSMGPEAMERATGRTHDGWRSVLTEAGARDWDHAAIARHLVEQHDVDGWWAQAITVDFEQACKGRLPGQRADGTFSASKTMTIPGEPLDALAAVASGVTARHGEAHGQNLTASMPNVRWRLPDGTRLAAAVQGRNKSGIPVNLTWEKLASAEAALLAKAELEEILTEARHGG
ncbi:MAG: hypothetical protein Q4F65_10885 [Propionibacteriaceae bacterium]|nr:hypothetical protein [Propionibacteriaceae bacterium]